MLFDPDALSDKAEETADLDKLLSALQDCDLNEWDQDFVDNMTKRAARFGTRTTVTPLQWEQLERMRKQYHVKS